MTAVVTVRRPLPTHAGQLSVSGLDDEVTVVRDARGVPTITAASSHDLFFAQGYTDAQDRFFLMDYRRHMASGTLAALVGDQDGAIESDMVVRTMGWRKVAEKELTLLSPTTVGYLQAYAEGVNAYLYKRPVNNIAVEYPLLQIHLPVHDPAVWDPVDSLVWLKAIAWDLRGNDADELARTQALRKLNDPDAVATLFPPYPGETNTPIVNEPLPAPVAVAGPAVPPAAGALDGAADALAAVGHGLGDGAGVGSNSWVVSGEHTTSGRPLLASDLHMAVSQPGVWSQVGLRCAKVTPQCPFDASGFSTAGFPGVMIGHNASLAWTWTAMGADVTDLFAERVDGDDVLGPDGTRTPMAVRTETIKVAGGDRVPLTVRTTRHGPVVSDVLDTNSARPNRTSYEVALSWAGLTPGLTADALFALSTASDADAVQAAAASFHAPAVNIVFGTTDGHIGYQAAGRIPVREVVVGADPPTDGTWPRRGWEDGASWTGWMDPAGLPHVLDPAEGFIIAANQQVGGVDLPGDWDYGYRSQRIRTLLTTMLADGPLDVAAMQRIALDKHSPAAEVLLDSLLKIEIDDSWEAAGQELLRTWDMQMDADSPAAMYFAAVWKIVLAKTFADELPGGLIGDSRAVELIAQIVDYPHSPWWDDAATPRVTEGRDEVLLRAMTRARTELTAQLGSDPSTWKWGTLHHVTPTHPVLGDASWPVRRLVNVSSRPVGGSMVSVDATTWEPGTEEEPTVRNCYTVVTAPSMRMVVDLGDLDASTWVNLAGTSGHPASSHYSDQFGAWASGRYYSWPFGVDAVRGAGKQTLRLVP
ncbi:MAG: penicillin acylase family protein [Micrococcales bacterium]|nr:penicillin acylase family protein [Micrococcales bacterium]